MIQNLPHLVKIRFSCKDYLQPLILNSFKTQENGLHPCYKLCSNFETLKMMAMNDPALKNSVKRMETKNLTAEEDATVSLYRGFYLEKE